MVFLQLMASRSSQEADRLLNDLLSNNHPDERGWDHGASDPELFHYSPELIVPGGKVLDVGIGYVRTSLLFALSGMEVMGYERNPEAATLVRAMARRHKLPIRINQTDIRNARFGHDKYDLTLMGHTFTHFDDKSAALDVMQRAINATRPGGHVWIRAAGKEDSGYQTALAYYPSSLKENRDVVWQQSHCIGTDGLVPLLFFDQTEILQRFITNGMRIVHSSIMPEIGRKNIMFGEDDYQHWMASGRVNGVITLLAQKK